MIADKARNFIPLYEAVLTAILIPNLKVESPAILFNREKVDCLPSSVSGLRKRNSPKRLTVTGGG